MLLPRTDITVPDWAAQNRVLPEYAAITGMWNNDIVNYYVQPMLDYTNPDIISITLVASAQVGKTELLNNMIGYTIDVDPHSMLLMHPTIDAARKYSKGKLHPMLDDTKCLKGKIARKRSRDGEYTTLYVRFAGGFLILVGANSPVGLRGVSIAKVIVDDIDAIEKERGKLGIKEGDPIQRAEKRTKTFRGKRKHVRASTPTIKGESRIMDLYEKSNKCKPFIACKHCKHQFVIDFFKHIHWDKEEDLFKRVTKHKTETVYLECPECKGRMYEKDKYYMIQNVEWKAERPQRKQHTGYWINELYSLFSTWKEVADEFLDSKDDREKLEVFYNLTLGLPFEKMREYKMPAIKDLVERCENYFTDKDLKIPNEVLLIVCSVDTQPDRFEVQTVGWGIDEEAWLLTHIRLWGDTDQQDVKDELDMFLETTYERKDGVQIGITITGIDSGGSNTESIYNYTRERQHNDVYSLKGKGGTGKAILLNKVMVSALKDVILINIGVDGCKDIIYRRIRNKKKSGSYVIHFNNHALNYVHHPGMRADSITIEDYFDQLLGEKPQRKWKPSLGVVTEWIPKKKDQRVEILDLWNYNFAMMRAWLPNFEAIKERLDNQKNKKDEPVETEIIKLPEPPEQSDKFKGIY